MFFFFELELAVIQVVDFPVIRTSEPSAEITCIFITTRDDVALTISSALMMKRSRSKSHKNEKIRHHALGAKCCPLIESICTSVMYVY